MGLHTWFIKDRAIYIELDSKYQNIEDYYAGMLSEEEYANIDIESLELSVYELENIDNDTEFHDIFRTSKREANGEYCTDVIDSYEETELWLETNKQHLYTHTNNDVNITDILAKVRVFWDKYPNGRIYFG